MSRDREYGPGGGGPGGGGGGGGKRRRRVRRIEFIDYKDVPTLRKFLSPNGKLHSRKRNSADAKTQNKVQAAVKRARFMGLLSYTN
ncbi:MAG: 30S ribosomal protein S18 [Planctomycetota bacterium]